MDKDFIQASNMDVNAQVQEIRQLAKEVREKFPKEARGVLRADAWSNAISGLGTSVDKRSATKLRGVPIVTKEEAIDMYTDGFIRNLVDMYPDDMTRQWISLPKNPEVIDELRVLNAQKYYNMGLKWARLTGGSILYMVIQDGGSSRDPVRMDKIKKIEGFLVFDLTEIDTAGSEWDTDVNSPTYGKIIRYKIRPKQQYASTSTPERFLHHTRVVEFHGDEMPRSVLGQANNLEASYWGVNCIQAVFPYVSDLMAAMANVSAILYELVIGKYKFADLDEMLAQGNEGALKTRMNAIELTKSILHAVLLGADEDYVRDSVALNGVPDILDRYMILVASVAKCPVTKLFGRAASGLNATGENDIKNYYDTVHSRQENELTVPIQKLCAMVGAYLKTPAVGQVVWNPLVQLSAQELTEKERIESESFRTKMAGYQLAVTIGALLPEDVYKLEFEEKLGKRPSTAFPMPDYESNDTQTEETQKDIDKEAAQNGPNRAKDKNA